MGLALIVCVLPAEASGDRTYCWNLSFVDRNNGWVICSTRLETTILHSTDGGKSWTRQFRIKEGLFDLKFVNKLDGWSVGTSGTVIQTTDGGKSWITRKAGTSVALTAIDVYGSNVWVVGSNGFIAHSKDSGKAWANSQADFNETLHDIRFVDSSKGYAIGYGKILSTDDAGSTWRVIDSPEWKHLGIIAARPSGTWITAETALLGIAGTKPDLLVNILPEQGKITDISLVDDSHGWVVKARATGGGENDSEGIILTTKDGGTSWSKQASFKSMRDDSYLFVSVSFVDRLHGWVLGRNGTLIRTVDGGKTWKQNLIIKS